MKEYEGWLIGIISKRPLEVLQILCDLLDAGLRRGYCSANDIKARQWSSPNVVGATFKLLKGFGFVQLDARIANTTKSSNGRKVHMWELRNHTKALLTKQHVAKMILGIEPTKAKQGELEL